MENCGSAVMSVISFLRGQLINHDTPPVPQYPRSKPGRPLSEVEEVASSLQVLYGQSGPGINPSPSGLASRDHNSVAQHLLQGVGAAVQFCKAQDKP